LRMIFLGDPGVLHWDYELGSVSWKLRLVSFLP